MSDPEDTTPDVVAAVDADLGTPPGLAADGDVQRALAAVTAYLDRAGVEARERQHTATEVVLGLLNDGWTLLPPGQNCAWGFRVPGLERVHEQGERAARRVVKAAPVLELVTEIRPGWRTITD